MRMAHQGRFARRRFLGLFEQGLQTPGRALQEQRFDPAGH
jgi:hypothetical protein